MATELQPVLDRTVQAAQGFGWNEAVLFLADGTRAYPAAAAALDPARQALLLARPPALHDPAVWRQDQFRISRSYLAGEVLVVPLDHALGWLCLSDPVDRQRPTPDQLRPLELFVGQASLTIRQVVLNAIARTISQNLEMGELFAAVNVQLQQTAFVGRSSITLREGQRPHARIFVQDAADPEVPQTPGPLENLAFAQTIQRGHTYRLCPDLAQAAELPEEQQLLEAGFRSYICLPLAVWGQVIGAFSLATRQPGYFSEEDSGFLTQIADHVGTGVWNTLLYELEQKRRRTADALAALAKLVNSTLELDQVLGTALQQLSSLIPYDTASILLVEGENLVITACSGFENPQSLLGATFRVEEGNISHLVMRSKQVRVVEDVQLLPEWGHNRSDVEGYQQIHAWIGAPLVVRDQSIGLLVLDKFQVGFFSEEDGETAAAFATQITSAINNARLYHTTLRQRDRLSSILNDTTDAIIVLDNANQVWMLNPAAARNLKLDHDAVIGQPVGALKLPELEAALEKMQRSRKPTRVEITRPNRSYNASIAPVRDAGWVIVMQDITPLKELDRLRTEWVAAVSHDLKNPIQVIQLGAALLEMDGPLNELQLERVMIILRGAEQLRSLVTNVLDLARLEAGPAIRLADLNLADVIQAAFAEVEHLAQKQQQLLINGTPPDLPPLRGDATLLQRALANLLSNAIKYTPVGGTIRLHTTVNKKTVGIDVIDNGPGIPADALPHLFDRFYRVPGTLAEGTGLGLSIVKSIVEKHHGSTHVKSTEGVGSTFTILLPLPA
jgi:PAS domain S-box-containing protein